MWDIIVTSIFLVAGIIYLFSNEYLLGCCLLYLCAASLIYTLKERYIIRKEKTNYNETAASLHQYRQQLVVEQNEAKDDIDDYIDLDTLSKIDEVKELRQAVFARDKGKCQLCGAIGEHVHHRIPRSKGGTDDLSNLILLCSQCHAAKHPSLVKLVNSSDAHLIHHRLLDIRRVKFKKQAARKEYQCYICRKPIYPHDEYYYGRKLLYSAPALGSRYPTLESSASVHLCVTCVVKYKHDLSFIKD